MGISDVLPRANLKIEKGKLVEQAYDECDALIL